MSPHGSSKDSKRAFARDPFKVALQEELYAWNPTRMKNVERTLMQAGMIDNVIQTKKYFNVRFSRVCCG
jgi:hypothetical protein